MSHIWSDITSVLFAITSIFLVFIVLLQRGRGGGLAGAFGAMGGQSAFGTKAGDVFTKITIVIAVIWVALAGLTGFAMTREQQPGTRYQSEAKDSVESVPPIPNAAKDKGANPFPDEDQKATNPADKDAKGKADTSSKPDAKAKPDTKTTPASKPQAGAANPPAGSAQDSGSKTGTPPATGK